MVGNLKELQERLLWLESFGNTVRLLEGITDAKVTHLAAKARVLDAAELKGVGHEKRRAMLVCLIHRAKVTARRPGGDAGEDARQGPQTC